MRSVLQGSLMFREAAAYARQGLLLSRGATGIRGASPESREGLTVFVHGYMASGGVFEPLAKHLQDEGLAPWQAHLNYAPFGSVESLAQRLDALIRGSGVRGPVSIVAHSLGGLVGRYYAQVLGRPLSKLVCLATPHTGTSLASRFSGLPLAKEIAPGSETLQLLERTKDRLHGARVCSLVAEGDLMVTPVESAALAGHEVQRLAGVGHQGILFDRAAWAHVRRVLSEK